MKSIVLINPYPSAVRGINNATIEPPLGLAYLASYLREHGFECHIIDANVLRMPVPEVLKYIQDINPSLVGISTNVITHKDGIILAQEIRRQWLKLPIVLGGPLPSSLPYTALGVADVVVIGEGEETLLEIVKNITQNKHEPYKDVLGCVYGSPGNPTTNKPRPLIQNLNCLPFPAHDLLPPFIRYKRRAKRLPVGAIITSRGCSYQCVFCNKNIFQRKLRMRSVDNILEEIDWLINLYHIKQIDILDDNVTMDIERAKELFLRLKPYKLDINLQNGIRADRCDFELLKIMKESGVYKLSIGVESGDLDIQRTIKKHLQLERVLEVTQWAKSLGIIVYGNFMIGLPGDTPDTMQKTINFAIKMDPHIANFMMTIPFPGTELYEKVQSDGEFLIPIQNGVQSGFYGGEVFYLLPGMDQNAILDAFKKAYTQFYYRPKKLLELFSRIRSFSEAKWLMSVAYELLRSTTWRMQNNA